MSVISVSVVIMNASGICTEEEDEEGRGRIEIIGDFAIHKYFLLIIH